MKALKIVGLVILSLVLFVSLSVFGLALTVNSTVLNPNFIPNELDRLNVTALVQETVDESDLPSGTFEYLIRAFDILEPRVKGQIRVATSQVYSYLSGREQSIDLKQVLRDSLLSDDFVISIMSESNMLALVRQELRDEIVNSLPSNQQQLVRYLDQALPDLDPWLKEQINRSVSPIVDFIISDRPNLYIEASLDPVKSTLRASLREAFMNAPPAEFSGYSSQQLDVVFNQYFETFASEIGDTLIIDPSTLGIDSPDSLTKTLADAETVLAQARTAVGYFRLAFILLIVLIVLLVAGIILVHRNVKGAARDLGIIFLVYGALELVGIFIARYFALSNLRLTDMPEAVRSWLPGLFSDMVRPLGIMSLVLAIIGIGLIVLSIVYRRRPVQPAPTASDLPV